MELLESEDKDETFGPEINSAVAKRMQNIMAQVPTKEALDKIKQKLAIPENCPFLNAPKVNPELWSQLPMRAKATDARMQHYQLLSAKSISSFAQIANEITKSSKQIPKTVSETILKLCLDGAALNAMQHKETNQKRKQTIKPLLSQNYSGICSTTAPDSSRFLFGDNLAETVKASRSVTNLMKSGQSRFVPYSRGRSSYNLNMRGQFRGQYRGGYRGRPMYRNRFDRNRPQFQASQQSASYSQQ